MPGHRYTGPGNPLDKQLKYNPNTGKPKSDQIKCKSDADRKMVKALDSIPWKERQWGHTVARNAIAAKAKLGLGVEKQGKSKNVKSRRVKKTGKKN